MKYNFIDFFKSQSKQLFKDYKTRYYNEEGRVYAYKPKHYDIVSIFRYFEKSDQEKNFSFTLMNAQHLMAKMGGFKGWEELIDATDMELESAKTSILRFKLTQDTQILEGMKTDTQGNSKPQIDRKVKYYSALDEAGNLVYIDDVNVENRDQHIYRCPVCKGAMIPALGEKNTHHFRHDGEHCSYESYLHTIAKLRFKDAFEQRDKFLIRADVTNACDRFDECILRENRLITDCKDNYKKVLNLKDIYDVCELEKKYRDFTADVLLSDSQGKHEPMFLEIYVSHPCDEGKIQSGIPIIEFKINDEKDLEELLKQTVFEEQRNVPVRNKKNKTEDKVIFYNLKDLKPYENLYGNNRYHSNIFSLKDLYVCSDKENSPHRVPVICHDFHIGNHTTPNAILFKTKDDLDKDYVKRCILVLNGKKNPCCEQCKYVKRRKITKNFYIHPFYNAPWPLQCPNLYCEKGGKIRFTTINIHTGELIDMVDSLNYIQDTQGEGLGFSSIIEKEYKCDLFELDDEKIKKDIEQYGLVGFVKIESK